MHATREKPAHHNVRSSARSQSSGAIQGKKIRFTLDLTPEMKTAIDELASISGTTQADILRRAIALLRAAKQGEQQGESIAMVKDDKVVARLVGV